MLLHVASHNPKKLAELKTILEKEGITGIELVSSHDLLGYPEPVENGRTFADNALIKARAGAKNTHLVTIADDSGLTVDELNGCPGVLSARWCGKHGNDQANNELLLAQMADVPVKRRTAQFVSVCAVVTPDGEEWIEKGVWAGRLLKQPVGKNGFGYDPLFVPEEEDLRVEDTDERPHTAGELDPEAKNAMSHRAKALHALVPVLRELAERAEQEGTSVTALKPSPLSVEMRDTKLADDESHLTELADSITRARAKEEELKTPPELS